MITVPFNLPSVPEVFCSRSGEASQLRSEAACYKTLHGLSQTYLADQLLSFFTLLDAGKREDLWYLQIGLVQLVNIWHIYI